MTIIEYEFFIKFTIWEKVWEGLLFGPGNSYLFKLTVKCNSDSDTSFLIKHHWNIF